MVMLAPPRDPVCGLCGRGPIVGHAYLPNGVSSERLAPIPIHVCQACTERVPAFEPLLKEGTL